MIKPVFLVTDILLFLLVLSVVTFIFCVRRSAHWRKVFIAILQRPLGFGSFIILMAYVGVGVIDSVHYQKALPEQSAGHRYYSPQLHSVLDSLLSSLGEHSEKTYSSPLAIKSYVKESIYQADGSFKRDYPNLHYAGRKLSHEDEHSRAIGLGILMGVVNGVLFFAVLASIFIYFLAKHSQQSWKVQAIAICQGKTTLAWRSAFIVMMIIAVLLSVFYHLSLDYHVLGTDKIGHDVLYEAVKSIRTGLILGSITTLVMLPFALIFGMMAGYFGGWIDDIIQYIYTTLSSIPGVLLIAAAILSIQVFISNHPDMFHSLAARADARLFALCLILGITSWTNLCRVLRAETLKIRELDYIQAAIVLKTHWFLILWRHILPNVMHLILIAVVLDFSSLVLAEAVLTYVGVSVDPMTASWGNMINAARLELAREPLVWWPILAAFLFMFVFVLAANLFADCVRDALDLRQRKMN